MNSVNLMIQLMILLGKFHIHKLKWNGSKASDHGFAVELKQHGTFTEYVNNIINELCTHLDCTKCCPFCLTVVTIPLCCK